MSQIYTKSCLGRGKFKFTPSQTCAHCRICQKNCLFLQKYDITIGDIEAHEELLYHCFLCGKCTQTCPEGIDGRARILHLRGKQVQENGGVVKEGGYDMLIRELQEPDCRERSFPGVQLSGILSKDDGAYHKAS